MAARMASATPDAARRTKPPVSPTASEVTDRREQILEAAQKLFAEKGFRETNLNDVATQLGFRRQPSITTSGQKRRSSTNSSTVPARLSRHRPGEPWTLTFRRRRPLAEVVRNHVRQLLTAYRHLQNQFSELFKLSGERADGLRRDMLDYVNDVATVIEAGQRDGTFVDVPPTTQALLILSMCNGTIDWYGIAGQSWTVDQVADYAARMALAGAQASRRQPDRPDRQLFLCGYGPLAGDIN